MLKLQPNPTFKAKVGIPLATGQRAEIECEFRWMPTKRLQAFLVEAMGAALPVKWHQALAQWALRLLSRAPLVGGWASAQVKPRRSEWDYVADIVAGWSGVDLPFGREAFERLAELHPAAPALIVEAWAKGLAENRLGN